jgi:formamidopyrimidine-DNA glycosylase
MPELPDVEVFRRYLDATALHKKIEGVKVGKKRVLEGVSAARLDKALAGRELERTHRHGKHLLVQTSDSQWLALHFGMTGFLRYYQKQSRQPEHVRLTIAFKNDYKLAFDNQRLLGRISLAADPDRFTEEKELGPDALDGLSREDFDNILRSTRARLKAALMNQKKMAGIGNVYSDEILLQARIHPEHSSNRLDGRQTDRLHRCLRRVLKKAIAVGADPGKMPGSYLTPRRQKDAPCPRCDGKLDAISFSGRSAYYCPSCQKNSSTRD